MLPIPFDLLRNTSTSCVFRDVGNYEWIKPRDWKCASREMEKQLTGPTSLRGTTSRFLKYLIFLLPSAHSGSRVKSPSNSQTGKLSIIYWHGTGCDFYASLFSRNWREIVEHRRFREIGPCWHHEVDASGKIMQHGLERGVFRFTI